MSRDNRNDFEMALINLLLKMNTSLTRDEILEIVKNQNWIEDRIKQRLRDLVSKGDIEMLGEQDLNRIENDDDNTMFRMPKK